MPKLQTHKQAKLLVSTDW